MTSDFLWSAALPSVFSLAVCFKNTLFAGTLHPPWQFSYVEFYVVLAQLSLLCWPPLVHEKFLSIFFCLTKAVTRLILPPKSCTDYLLSSEFPRLERDTSPPEHTPYARTQRGFACLIPLKISSRPGLGEAGPQEKLRSTGGLRISSSLQS